MVETGSVQVSAPDALATGARVSAFHTEDGLGGLSVPGRAWPRPAGPEPAVPGRQAPGEWAGVPALGVGGARPSF